MRSGDDNCVIGSGMDHLPHRRKPSALARHTLSIYAARYWPRRCRLPRLCHPTNPERENAPCFPFRRYRSLLFHLGNNLISEKGINQETSGATRAQTEDFHNVGYLGVAEAPILFFKFIPHAQIDSFSTSALSAAQEEVMVAMAVSQTTNLRSVFANPALNNPGLFELFEATIDRNQVTGVRRQGGKGFLG